MDLVAIEEIKRLKHRYLRTLDLKRWDEFADCLEPDCQAEYGERLSFSGRDDIVAYMRKSLGPELITMHHCHHPEIDIDPGAHEASGTWALEDKVILWKDRLMITGATFYEDRYRRDASGAWRIARTGYVRLFEAIQPLPEGFRLTANRWADA